MRKVYSDAVIKTVRDFMRDHKGRVMDTADQAMMFCAEMCLAAADVLEKTEPGANVSIGALRDAELELRSIVAWDDRPVDFMTKYPPPPGAKK